MHCEWMVPVCLLHGSVVIVPVAVIGHFYIFQGSLLSKLPKDQAESNSFLAYIEQLVIIK